MLASAAGLRRALRPASVLLGFAALTAVMTWPLSRDPGTRAMTLSADTRLGFWVIGWDVHALATQPLRLFDANIFYPNRRTLAYAEHLVGSAFVGGPFLAATGNPVLALNVIALFACFACGVGAYVLGRRLGLGLPGALVAGVVFSLGPPRFFRIAQPHLSVVQWVPLCLAFLHAYFRDRKPWQLWLATLFFTLEALSSGHGGVFLVLASLALLAYLVFVGERVALSRALRDFGLVGLLLLLVNVAFLVPYVQVRKEIGLKRTLGAVDDWTPNAVSFLAAPTHGQRLLLAPFPELRQEVEKEARAYLFPGWTALLLAGVALWPRRRGAGAPALDEREGAGVDVPGEAASSAPLPRWPPWRVALLDGAILLFALAALTIHVADGIEWEIGALRVTARSAGRPLAAVVVLLAVRVAMSRRAPFLLARPWARAGAAYRAWAVRTLGLDAGFYVLLGAVSLWAAWGPRLWLYTVLYRLLPGFDFIRVPSRLTILTLLCLAVLSGFGLERLIRARARTTSVALAAAVLLLLSAEYAAFPLQAPPYDLDIPAVDRWLAEQPRPFALVEFPVVDPMEGVQYARLNSRYMLHSTVHWQRMLNGYSGFVPPRHELLFRRLQQFPDDHSVATLAEWGVSYAVVHLDYYPEGQRAAVEERLAAMGGRLKLLRAEGDGRVYQLPAAR